MPIRTVYQATIEHTQILDERGVLDPALSKPGTPGILTDEQVLHLYERMLEARAVDERAFVLQRSNRMYTYPQNKGQEAAALGSGFAMRRGTDWIVPCYRENAAMVMHGMPWHHIYLHWMGDERGNVVPPGVRVMPIAVPIGTQMLHATGIAWAAKLRREDAVVITYFGDGATSEGDFHEALNFAATFGVPAIFFCQNNQWAISVPRETQTASETIAQKGLGYGAACQQVDGNDLFAVHKAVYDARERARAGGGVTIIEAMTYRLGDHTTADDARRYRDQAEVEAWQARDPILRTRVYLESKGLWDAQRQRAGEERAKAFATEVVRAAEGIAPPKPEEMFDHLYAEMPPELRLQRDTKRTSSLGQDPSQAGLRSEPQRA